MHYRMYIGVLVYAISEPACQIVTVWSTATGQQVPQSPERASEAMHKDGFSLMFYPSSVMACAASVMACAAESMYKLCRVVRKC